MGMNVESEVAERGWRVCYLGAGRRLLERRGVLNANEVAGDGLLETLITYTHSRIQLPSLVLIFQ